MNSKTNEAYKDVKYIDANKDMEVKDGNVKKVSKTIKNRMTPRILVPLSLANGILIQASRADAECDFPLIYAMIVVGGFIMGFYMIQVLITHTASWVLKDRTIDTIERRVLKFLRGLSYFSYFIQAGLLLAATYWIISLELSRHNEKRVVITQVDGGRAHKEQLCKEFYEESMPNEKCPFVYCDYFAYQFTVYMIYTFWSCLAVALACLSYIYIANMYYNQEH